MEKINAFDSVRSIELPNEEMLRHWSFPTMLERSTNKLGITDDIVEMVKLDAHSYKTLMQEDRLAQQFNYRVKAPESIERKVRRHPDLRFQSVFNDILGIRIEQSDYLNEVPAYYRLVDLTKGKAHDDGYHAQHLYYKLDNYHYTIEVQIWAGRDIPFNTWMHTLTYKYLPSDVSLELRNMYDAGKINTFDEFVQEVRRVWR